MFNKLVLQELYIIPNYYKTYIFHSKYFFQDYEVNSIF